MGIVEIIKAIPAIVGLVRSVYSFVKHLQEQHHKDAISSLDQAQTIKEKKDALSDIAKHP